MTFRIILMILLGAMVSLSTIYRLKATQTDDAISWQDEGFALMIALRLSGVIMWLSVIIYLLNPDGMAWSSLNLPFWLRSVGVGLGIFTLPLAYWVFSSLGKNITTTVAIRKNHSLVTHGPYRWIRHPLYMVGALFFSSISLLTANWFIALSGLTMLLMLWVRLPKEEANLLERFGDEYRIYMARTERFLPKWRKK